MFGYRFIVIHKDDWKDIERAVYIKNRLVEVHLWFSGWRDLEIIWDYVFAETYFGSIGSARSKYAEARGTDDYGVPNENK